MRPYQPVAISMLILTSIILHFSILQTLLDIGYSGYFTFETDTPKPQRTRPPFVKDCVRIERLNKIFPELRKHSLVFLHETGRLMLEAYDCYEDS